jgi:uncharacterized protein (DUF1330 family)
MVQLVKNGEREQPHLGKIRTQRRATLIETYYAIALAAIFGAAAGAAVAGRKAPRTPKAYVVTEVDLTGDMTTFQRDYAAHAQATIEPFGGRYLVRGGRSVGIEGEPPKPRIVISMFDSFDQAQAWRNSAAYVKIAAVREREAKSRQYIVEGLPE